MPHTEQRRPVKRIVELEGRR